MRSKRTGFTIIECLISLLILVILMTGGMAFYQHSNNMMKAATHKRIALEIANAKMEALKNSGYDSVSAEASHDISIAGLAGKESVSVIDNTGYKDVTIEIMWPDPAGKAGNQTVKLETYIADIAH